MGHVWNDAHRGKPKYSRDKLVPVSRKYMGFLEPPFFCLHTWAHQFLDVMSFNSLKSYLRPTSVGRGFVIGVTKSPCHRQLIGTFTVFGTSRFPPIISALPIKRGKTENLLNYDRRNVGWLLKVKQMLCETCLFRYTCIHFDEVDLNEKICCLERADSN
jgi:hypothetical protein